MLTVFCRISKQAGIGIKDYESVVAGLQLEPALRFPWRTKKPSRDTMANRNSAINCRAEFEGTFGLRCLSGEVDTPAGGANAEGFGTRVGSQNCAIGSFGCRQDENPLPERRLSGQPVRARVGLVIN
jgi:hypothetical protein